LLALLLDDRSGNADFPPHGVVALSSEDEGDSWRVDWEEGSGKRDEE
jgi:hypothetical protein